MARVLIGLSTRRLLVPLALSAPTSLANFCEKVTLFVGARIFPSRKFASPGAYLILSAVRSHNVARVNKSYESFGDKFATVVIDDLVSSDLVPAVKGMRYEFPLYLMAEHTFQESMLSFTSRPHSPMLPRQT